MKNILSLVLMILLSIIFLPIKKKNNKIIINSFKNNKYNFYSRVFFEYLIKNKEKNNLIVKFVINNKEERDRLNQTIGPYFIDSKTFKGIIEILSSKYWISSCKPIYSFPLALLNRMKINVWHGVPFKTIALKDKNQNKIKKIIYKYYYSNIFYDLFLCSSSETSKLFKESFSLNEKNIYIGGSLAGEMFGESIDKVSNDVVKNLLQQGRKKRFCMPPHIEIMEKPFTSHFPKWKKMNLSPS
ncbi:CDP-glycerol glycerophosphotransferase family protein [Providencia rettgeri]